MHRFQPRTYRAIVLCVRKNSRFTFCLDTKTQKKIEFYKLPPHHKMVKQPMHNRLHRLGKNNNSMKHKQTRYKNHSNQLHREQNLAKQTSEQAGQGESKTFH